MPVMRKRPRVTWSTLYRRAGEILRLKERGLIVIALLVYGVAGIQQDGSPLIVWWVKQKINPPILRKDSRLPECSDRHLSIEMNANLWDVFTALGPPDESSFRQAPGEAQDWVYPCAEGQLVLSFREDGVNSIVERFAPSEGSPK